MRVQVDELSLRGHFCCVTAQGERCKVYPEKLLKCII
jgi:hypothetical protein